MAEPAIELAPELGPEIEVTARAAPRIGLVAILAVTLGIILSVEAIVRGFFGTVSGAVGWIPYLGNVIEQPIHKIEQKIISMLGGLEHDIDKALAHNIHVAAMLLDKLWHSLELMAANIVLLGFLSAGAFFHYLIHPIERLIHTAIKRVEAGISHAIRFVHNVESATIHKIEHWLWPQIRRAIVAVPRFIHRDLLHLRHDVNSAKKTATLALHQVEAIPFPEGATTWAAAVAIALPQLGLDWLNCKTNPFNKNTKACGLWNDLKSLLGLLGGVALFASVCEFLLFASPFVGAVADFVIPKLTDVGAGLCKGSIGPPPPLPTATLYLPANPGITLDLP